MRHHLVIRPAAGMAAGAALLGLAALGTLPALAAGAPTTVVYTMRDAGAAQGGNAVLAFRSDGAALTPMGSFPTGGDGSGAGLGSQGGLALTDGGRRLLAVNAGSNTVSAFDVRSDGSLGLLGSAWSGGTDPISVTARGSRVEVLNAGSLNVAGLMLRGDHIIALSSPGTSAPLSSGASSPEQVSFNPGGTSLIVAEKGSGTLDTFAVEQDGQLGSAVSTPSTGAAPYGFGFDRWGHLVVSDAGPSAVTTYDLESNGGLGAISFLADGQAAACWLVVGPDGDHAYTANAGSGTISSYLVSGSGQLSLVAAVATSPGGHPLDLAIAGGSLFINNASMTGSIDAAGLQGGGRLGTSSAAASGIPATATGLVAITLA
jgi:6-phosphogluconolactonase